jgi:hypothetical protein
MQRAAGRGRRLADYLSLILLRYVSLPLADAFSLWVPLLYTAFLLLRNHNKRHLDITKLPKPRIEPTGGHSGAYKRGNEASDSG